MKVLWFLPTSGDGRYLGTTKGGRATDFGYLKQIAQAVDELGYTGALLPTGRGCEDAWITASALVSVTQRMKFLVAVRPGLMPPTLSVRMATTFDRMSNGRLLINVVTGGDPGDLQGDGLHYSHDDRYKLTDEFLTLWRQLASGEEVNHKGQFFDIEGGQSLFPTVQKPYPPLWFGGSSPAALDIAARHVDTYLTWGEPPAMVAQKLTEMRDLAAKYGRTLKFGIRLHVIVRETTEEAWQAADDLIRYLDDETIAKAQKILAQAESVGQQRMRQLHNGNRANLEVSPNLWAGVGLVRSGAGTALVGDPQTVAARIQEYADLGIDTFIMSGYPHLEEAYRFAELVFPLLPLETVGRLTDGPVGEPIADQHQRADQQLVTTGSGSIRTV